VLSGFHFTVVVALVVWFGAQESVPPWAGIELERREAGTRFFELTDGENTHLFLLDSGVRRLTLDENRAATLEAVAPTGPAEENTPPVARFYFPGTRHSFAAPYEAMDLPSILNGYTGLISPQHMGQWGCLRVDFAESYLTLSDDAECVPRGNDPVRFTPMRREEREHGPYFISAYGERADGEGGRYLIDTGASISVFRSNALTLTGSVQSGSQLVETLSGNRSFERFEGEMCVFLEGHNIRLGAILVSDEYLDRYNEMQHIDGIIGMDVLADLELTIQGEEIFGVFGNVDTLHPEC
jgi:hypothetical protein